MKRFRSIFLVLSLMMFLAPSSVRAVDKIDVLLGFYAEKPTAQAPRINLQDRIFAFEAITTPINRRLVSGSRMLYVDRFPSGYEMFKDDQAALKAMVENGGVALFMCGPDASPETRRNFNYLGLELGFEFATSTELTGLIPSKVGDGPIGGEIWGSKEEARAISFSTGEWHTYYYAPNSKAPLIASRRIGSGLLVVSGISEFKREIDGRSFNAVSFLDWSMDERQKPPRPRQVWPPEDMVRSGNGGAGDSLTAVESAHRKRPSFSQEPAGTFQGRVDQLRAQYGIEPLKERGASRYLQETMSRRFFPAMNLRDIDNNPLDIAAYSGSPVIVYFYASWSAESREILEVILEETKPYKNRGLQFIGVSLDKDEAAMRNFVLENGLPGPQIGLRDGWNSRLADALSVNPSYLPEIFFLDKKGRICAQKLTGVAPTIEAILNE